MSLALPMNSSFYKRLLETVMKIGLVRRGYSPSGGAEKYLKRFGESLAQMGHTPVLFCTDAWPEGEWPFGQIVRIDGASPMAFAEQFERTQDEHHCGCIFSLERLKSCDFYRAGDGLHRVWLEKRELFEPKWKTLTRFVNQKNAQILKLEESLFADHGAGRVIVNSNMVKQEILAHFSYPAEKIHIVHNGLPRRTFSHRPGIRQKLRDSLGTKKNELLVLFAGTGWARKGLQHAIAAVEKANATHPMRLVVAGRGSRLGYRSHRVEFLGQVSDMISWMDAADIFILPTLYDPFSNACLEALASGLPVITTRSNGFSEIITHGIHGNIVESPSDTHALADALVSWHDPEKREAAREANESLAADFSIEANVKATLDILLSQSKPLPLSSSNKS